MELYIFLVCLATVHGVHLTINWTHVSTLPLGCETHLNYQPGADLALCPCDLTSNFCDLNCCCDEDCNTSSISTSSCQSPAAQAQTEESVLPHTCKYLGPYSPEWHSFFCPVKENTPYLGLFYRPQKVIRDFQKYLALVKQQHYSYQKEDVHVPDQEYQPHYVLGAQVLMGEDLGGPVVQGALRFPQPVLEGVCIDTFPVHFLEDLNHECTVIMSPEKCESEASLSVANYLQPVGGAAPSGFLQVIGNLSSLGLVSASVEYEWLEEITAFIKVQGGGIPTVLTQSIASLKGNNLPYFNESAGQCNNVVLAVKYHLAWEGPAIIDIDATITLGNVPVFPEPKEEACATSREHNLTCAAPQASRLLPFSSTPQLLLVQHFMVKYHHTYAYASSNASGDATDLISEDREVGVLSHSERSGNPGYLVDRPLLAGYIEYSSTREENSTSSVLPTVTVSDSTGLYVWRPDESGKCHTSHLEKVTFGIDMLSACLFMWSDVILCSDLRARIEAALYSLVQADVIITLGWHNVTSEEDLLPIIFEQHRDDNKTSSDGCIIPSSLEYKIIYQDVLDEPRPSLVVHQVVGASVRLLYKKLHFVHNISAGFQLLTSSAVFFHHPRPSGLSRYWEFMEDHWCEGGTCWREILWPWTHGWAGMGWEEESHHPTSLASLLAHSLLGLALLIPPLALILSQGFRLPW